MRSKPTFLSKLKQIILKNMDCYTHIRIAIKLDRYAYKTYIKLIKQGDFFFFGEKQEKNAEPPADRL